ncbi:MAG: S-layer homology domain-containing protein [Clostridiaceae bacterium]|nr:S-layer homology domain-containing protein [Clostridiaceae bacterium]
MKGIKALKSILLVVLIIVTLIVPVTNVQAASRYSDVSPTHWAYKQIESIASKGIIGGYPDGTFRPNNSITREEAAKMIVFAVGLPNKGKISNFPDVPSKSWSTAVIAAARQNGIINGYPDGTFRPKGEISRQEAAAMVAKSFNLQQEIGAKKFSDVAANSWAKSSIDKLTSNNIVNGYPDGTFRPRKSITRAEFAVFIAKALKFGPADFYEPDPEAVHIILPSLPGEYSYGDYTKAKVLEMSYSYKPYSYNPGGTIDFNYRVQKTYQKSNTRIDSVAIRCKLMKNGVIVDTSHIIYFGANLGDIYMDVLTMWISEPGIYELVLSDYN